MDRVRVMLWCTTCVPGMQLPLFAAWTGGLFDAQGLTVEFLDPVRPRDLSLRGLSVRVAALAAGVCDIAVTGISYLLAAQAEAGTSVGARFVAALHQRSPIAGIVAESSDVSEPFDLAGKSIAGHGLSWMVQEYQGAMLRAGFDPGPVVETDGWGYGARSLTRGDVAVIPAWVDTVAGIQSNAGSTMRAVPLEVEVYASGLLAADRVPTDVVARFLTALAGGMALQRVQPETGVHAYHCRYPQVTKEYLRLAWALYVPNAVTCEDPLLAGRWEASAAFYAAVHNLPVPSTEDVCRTERIKERADDPAGLAASGS